MSGNQGLQITLNFVFCQFQKEYRSFLTFQFPQDDQNML